MYTFYFILFVLGVFVGILKIINNRKPLNFTNKPQYKYAKKNFLLTHAEHDFFDVLQKIVGNEYYVFPQIHLASLLDWKISSQYWSAAFRHINGKSVDFVLCDKAYISPKLVIELDDKTHQRSDRIQRDIEVKRILDEAHVPFLRIENHGSFNAEEIKGKIDENIGASNTKGYTAARSQKVFVK